MVAKEGYNYDDVCRMDSFTEDEYYDFFRSQNSRSLYFYVRKCLDMSGN